MISTLTKFWYNNNICLRKKPGRTFNLSIIMAPDSRPSSGLHPRARVRYPGTVLPYHAIHGQRLHVLLLRAAVASLWSNLAMGCYNAASLRSFSPHPCLPWFVRNGCIVNFACHGRTRIRYAVPDHSLDSFFAFATRTTVSI